MRKRGDVGERGGGRRDRDGARARRAGRRRGRGGGDRAGVLRGDERGRRARERGGVLRVERVRGDGVGERVDVVLAAEDARIGAFLARGARILERDRVRDVGGESEVAFQAWGRKRGEGRASRDGRGRGDGRGRNRGDFSGGARVGDRI